MQPSFHMTPIIFVIFLMKPYLTMQHAVLDEKASTVKNIIQYNELIF